jgi:hypothetical protein
MTSLVGGFLFAAAIYAYALIYIANDASNGFRSICKKRYWFLTIFIVSLFGTLFLKYLHGLTGVSVYIDIDPFSVFLLPSLAIIPAAAAGTLYGLIFTESPQQEA